MPRLTNHQYINRHELLQKLWRTNPDVFRFIKVAEQQVLHRYYVTPEQLSDDQLIARRQHFDVREPSLGARAGKAFAKLHDGSRTSVRVPAGTNGPRQLSVSAVVRPEPDIAKLVQAFKRLAEQQRAKQDEDQLPPAA